MTKAEFILNMEPNDLSNGPCPCACGEAIFVFENSYHEYVNNVGPWGSALVEFFSVPFQALLRCYHIHYGR